MTDPADESVTTAAGVVMPIGGAEDKLGRMKGRGVVTIFDGSDITTTSYTATGTQPLLMSGVKLHTLPRGAVFDMTTRALVSAPGLVDTSEPTVVATLADVPEGTRPRTRRIAAEGRHETVAELRRRPERRASS